MWRFRLVLCRRCRCRRLPTLYNGGMATGSTIRSSIATAIETIPLKGNLRLNVYVPERAGLTTRQPTTDEGSGWIRHCLCCASDARLGMDVSAGVPCDAGTTEPESQPKPGPEACCHLLHATRDADKAMAHNIRRGSSEAAARCTARD